MIRDGESTRIINLSCRFNNHNFYFDCFSGDFQTKVLSRGEVWERHIASFIEYKYEFSIFRHWS